MNNVDDIFALKKKKNKPLFEGRWGNNIKQRRAGWAEMCPGWPSKCAPPAPRHRVARAGKSPGASFCPKVLAPPIRHVVLSDLDSP